MRKLERYIGVSFLSGCMPVLLLLLTLFSFLGLSEELEDVGDGAYELVDALLVVLYTLPMLIVELLPVTALLGGLLGLGALANNRELTAIRAAAVSPLRIAWPVFKLGGALVVLVLILQSLVIPAVEYRAAQLRAKTLYEPSLEALDSNPGVSREAEFWTRNKGQFIRIGDVLEGRRLAGVEIYQFDAEGELVKMLQASSAQLLQDNTWQLHEVRETQLDGIHSQTLVRASLLWDALLSESQTRRLITPARAMAPADLWRSIQRLEANDMNSESQRVIFWRQMSVPVSLLGMALLALPFLLGSMRSVPVGQRIALGGLVGIGFYLVQQISGHLAGIMHWNVAATVLGPGMLVLLVALILLSRSGRAIG